MGRARRPRREEDGRPLVDCEDIRRLPTIMSEQVVPVVRRMRWGRIGGIVLGLMIVPRILVASMATGQQDSGLPPVVDESFIGPHAVIGYSPVTNAERKALAEEEIRLYNEEHGIVPESQGREEKDSDILVQADGSRQHEGDLVFDGAVRDNLIARAVRGWRHPSWIDGIDWDSIRAELSIADENSDSADGLGNHADAEKVGGDDESINGYDDILRVSFTEGVPFDWDAPNGMGFSYDGDGRMSGDMPMCLDLEGTVGHGSKAILVLDQEGNSREANRIVFGDGTDTYHSLSCADQVVPDESGNTMLFGTVSGCRMHEASLWRRDLMMEVTRMKREDADDSRLGIHMTAIAPPGMLSDESISATVETDDLVNLQVRLSCLGAEISTTDERGLDGVHARVRCLVDGKETVIDRTLETTDSHMTIGIDLERASLLGD